VAWKHPQSRIISKLPLFTGEDSKLTLFRMTRESEIFGQSKIVKNYLREIGSEMNKIDNVRVQNQPKVLKMNDCRSMLPFFPSARTLAIHSRRVVDLCVLLCACLFPVLLV
jgi:hypothetical protein